MYLFPGSVELFCRIIWLLGTGALQNATHLPSLLWNFWAVWSLTFLNLLHLRSCICQIGIIIAIHRLSWGSSEWFGKSAQNKARHIGFHTMLVVVAIVVVGVVVVVEVVVVTALLLSTLAFLFSTQDILSCCQTFASAAETTYYVMLFRCCCPYPVNARGITL